jgi:signal transduction histidine kinase
MAIIVVSSFGWNVIVQPYARVALTLLGVAYLAVGTFAWMWAERRGPRAVRWLTVALLVIALAGLWESHLGVMIVAMPAIGWAVIYGSVWWGIAVTTIVLGFSAVVSWHLGGTPVQIYSNSTGFLPGAIFVILVGLLIVSEREARQQVRRYAAEVEELATTRERNRIARDIHDSVGHYLTVVNVQIEAARATIGRDDSASRECLSRAQELARQGLGELRRSVSMLRAGGARPFGIALAELIDESSARGVATTLEVQGTPRPLVPAVEYTLFRTAQEALTNVAKHAQATHARCTLRYADAEVVLAVADDGVGAVTTEGGFGLVGLRERAELVGGTLQIRGGAGHGFTIEVSVVT